MATKQATSTGKKSSAKTTPTKKTSTTTTTVKAVSTSTSTSIFSNAKFTPFIGVLIAEFIGTFLLAAAYIDLQGSPLYVAFVAVGIVLLIGGFSGAHLNPAVTVGAWITRRIKGSRAIGYIVAQLLGALAAWATLTGFLQATVTDATTGTAATTLYHGATLISGKEWYIFFAELLGTAIVAFSVATALRTQGSKLVRGFTIGFGLLIGLAIAVSATAPLLSVASTGFTVLNPAVAFSLNAVTWDFWTIFIYVFAPLVGGIIGFVIQNILQSSQTDKVQA